MRNIRWGWILLGGFLVELAILATAEPACGTGQSSLQRASRIVHCLIWAGDVGRK